MELLDAEDRRSQLLKKSMKQREALKDEARLLSQRTEKAITNALIVGGALAVTYLVVRQFSRSGRKRKLKAGKPKRVVPAQEEEEFHAVYEPGVVAQIGTAIASQAATFLLTLAKEKLTEYMESHFIKKAEDNDRGS